HRRITRHDASLHRLANSLLDRRNEVARDRAAYDGIYELEARAPVRLHAYPAVSELAAPAGLLLVPALAFGLRRNRLAVRNLPVYHIHVRAELLQPLHDDSQVRLTRARDDRLARLRLAVELERRVGDGHALQGRSHLILVYLRLRDDRLLVDRRVE